MYYLMYLVYMHYLAAFLKAPKEDRAMISVRVVISTQANCLLWIDGYLPVDGF